MASMSSVTLQTMAFGAAPGGLWGAAWFADPAAPGLLVLAQGPDVSVREAWVETDRGDGTWQLRSDGDVLTVEAAGDAVDLSEGVRAPTGYGQRCRVSGPSFAEGGQVGVRGERHPEAALDCYESIRDVYAWFDDDEAASIIALRPRERRGHEEDEVAAAVMSPEPWGPLIDPRLSTTYAGAGEPARMVVELWSADEQQHPRRYAGEALHDAVRATAGEWQLHVAPFRCHARGQDGTGVYVLARRA